MIGLYESILTESIFSIGDPASAKKVVNVARMGDMKKYLFSGSNPIFTGAPLDGIRKQKDDLDKNVYITKNNILKISKLKRYDEGYLATSIDDRTKKLFDKNNVVGIKYIPSHAGDPNILSTLELSIPTKKDIDLKIDNGPFKIINSHNMFTDIVIRPKDIAPGRISCIKNLTLAGDNLNNIIINDHIFDNCDFGSCKLMLFRITSNNIRPVILMKNCKAIATRFRLNIIVKDDIFLEWKDYLMDENGPRKDLFKRLGIDNVTGIDFFRVRITRGSDEEELCIATNIRSDRYTCDIEKCRISGISKVIMYTKI